MTTITKEYKDESGIVWTETSSEPSAVSTIAPLTHTEVNDSINYYAEILVNVYNGATYSYLRHFHEYFEFTVFNETNTPEQHKQATNIYLALLDLQNL